MEQAYNYKPELYISLLLSLTLTSNVDTPVTLITALIALQRGCYRLSITTALSTDGRSTKERGNERMNERRKERRRDTSGEAV